MSEQTLRQIALTIGGEHLSNLALVALLIDSAFLNFGFSPRQLQKVEVELHHSLPWRGAIRLTVSGYAEGSGLHLITVRASTGFDAVDRATARILLSSSTVPSCFRECRSDQGRDRPTEDWTWSVSEDEVTAYLASISAEDMNTAVGIGMGVPPGLVIAGALRRGARSYSLASLRARFGRSLPAGMVVRANDYTDTIVSRDLSGTSIACISYVHGIS